MKENAISSTGSNLIMAPPTTAQTASLHNIPVKPIQIAKNTGEPGFHGLAWHDTASAIRGIRLRGRPGSFSASSLGSVLVFQPTDRRAPKIPLSWRAGSGHWRYVVL